MAQNNSLLVRFKKEGLKDDFRKVCGLYDVTMSEIVEELVKQYVEDNEIYLPVNTKDKGLRKPFKFKKKRAGENSAEAKEEKDSKK